ncbi:hypothetical protein B0H16DRAFT_1692418, partial [Mycena metata]
MAQTDRWMAPAQNVGADVQLASSKLRKTAAQRCIGSGRRCLRKLAAQIIVSCARRGHRAVAGRDVSARNGGAGAWLSGAVPGQRLDPNLAGYRLVLPELAGIAQDRVASQSTKKIDDEFNM